MTDILETYDYLFLSDEDRANMLKNAITQLERLLFENELNIEINDTAYVVTHEDGSEQTLGGKRQQYEHQLRKLRGTYEELLR